MSGFIPFRRSSHSSHGTPLEESAPFLSVNSGNVTDAGKFDDLMERLIDDSGKPQQELVFAHATNFFHRKQK
jgi:hypothetical protein